MTRPVTQLQVQLNGVWIDITSFVQMPDGITITRGRDNEQSDPSPGTMSFTLNNSDGRFTVGKTDGPYGAYFAKWVPVKLDVNGSRRFTGYVASAPTAADATLASATTVVVSCIDSKGLMELSPNISTWAHALIAANPPKYWWELADSAGSTAASATAGGIPLAASVSTVGYDVRDMVAFGVEGTATLESGTQAQIKVTSDANGFLSCSGVNPWPTGWGVWNPQVSVIVTYTPTEITKESDSLDLWSLQDGTHTLAAVRKGRALAIVVDSSTVITVSNFFTPDVPITFEVAGNRIAGISVFAGDGSVVGSTTTRVPLLSSSCVFTIGPCEGIYGNAMVNPTSTLSTFPISPVGPSGYLSFLNGAPKPVSTWLQRAINEAGLGYTVATVGANPTMYRPALQGSNPAEVGDEFANASGSMFATARDGTPTWLDHSYCPPRVDIDAKDFRPGLTSDSDDSLSFTEVWVDGALRATTGGFPRRGREITALMTAVDLYNFVNWLKNTADIWGGPRLKGLAVNLWPMGSAKEATYVALDLKSRIYPQNLSSIFPAPWIYSIEGYTETITDAVWLLAFNTAPDPRFVLNDSIAGVLDSNYRLAY